MVRTAETSSDPRQPRRLEKNKNTARCFPRRAAPNSHPTRFSSADEPDCDDRHSGERQENQGGNR